MNTLAVTTDTPNKSKNEAGIEARIRLIARRRRRTRNKILATLSWVLLVVLNCWILYKAWPAIVNYVVPAYDKYGQDYRPCIFKVGERTVTGNRSYEYRYMNLLGYKIYMTPDSEIKQETRLDIAFNAITIVGVINGESKKLQIEDGEKYKQLLPVAESYTFFMDGGKNVATVAYSDICK